MEEEYELNGYLLHVWIEKDDRGRYRWAYTINGGLYTDDLDRLFGHKVAVFAEVKSMAEAHVTRLTAQEVVLGKRQGLFVAKNRRFISEYQALIDNIDDLEFARDSAFQEGTTLLSTDIDAAERKFSASERASQKIVTAYGDTVKMQRAGSVLME